MVVATDQDAAVGQMIAVIVALPITADLLVDDLWVVWLHSPADLSFCIQAGSAWVREHTDVVVCHLVQKPFGLLFEQDVAVDPDTPL